MDLPANHRSGLRRRLVAIASVASIHLIAIMAVFSNLVTLPQPFATREFDVTIIGGAVPKIAAQALPAPQFIAPDSVAVDEPHFDIIDDGSTQGARATLPSQILPPRPEPGHLNLPPDLPAKVRKLIGNSSVILRLLVEADGSVSEALVVKGSSNRDIDNITIAHVEANWRFSPALQGGKPVQDWITVLVRVNA